MRRAALPAALAVWLAGAPAGAATLRVEIEPREATVGDPVRATLVLEGGPGEIAAEPRFPAWQKTWGEAEIVVAGAVERASGGYRQTLTLAAFRTGEVPLPPTAVVIPGQGEVSTPADLALRVRSVLPEGDAELQPKPPLPPRMLPWGDRFWWALAGGLVLALAAAALLWRRRRAARGEAALASAARLSPYDELAAQLERIAAEAARMPFERTHTALSLALRRYFGRALDFPAAESTTSEIQRQLRGRRLPGDVPQRATRLLRDCDGVKFARGESSAAETGVRLGEARSIARAVDEHLHPAPAPALEATA